MGELQTRVVEFNKLPEKVRERFVASASGREWPMPIVADRLAMGTAAAGWGFVLLCAVGGLGVLLFWGFGQVWDGLQSAGFIALYALCLFLAVYSLLAILKRKRLVSSLPYPPGRYLLPMDFVDARTDVLRIVPLAMLADFSGVHHHTNGAYTHTDLTFRFEDGSHETFTVRGKDQAELVLADLRQRQGEVSQAIQERNVEQLFMLDVFLEARLGETWEAEPPRFFDQPAGPQAKPLTGVLARAALVAGALGVVLAAPIWYARNLASDAAIFALLSSDAPEEMVQVYIDQGGRRAEEARNELLPRAALRDARNKGSVTALRGVVTKYADHAVAAEARGEIKALFAKTVADFKSQAAGEPGMLAFMDKLFAQLEKTDSPTVQVRFGKPSATDLQKADDFLNKEIKGGVVPISGHFNDASSAPRESAIVQSLQEAFSTIFPADILKLEQGPRLDRDAGALQQPVIDIHYDVQPSGDTYTSEQTGKNFVGIKVKFAVSMRLPKGAEDLSFVLEVEPPERFTVGPSPLDRYGLDAYSGPDAGRVYHAMATNAFAQLDGKLRKVFFKPGSSAYEGRGDQQVRPAGLGPG